MKKFRNWLKGVTFYPQLVPDDMHRIDHSNSNDITEFKRFNVVGMVALRNCLKTMKTPMMKHQGLLATNSWISQIFLCQVVCFQKNQELSIITLADRKTDKYL